MQRRHVNAPAGVQLLARFFVCTCDIVQAAAGAEIVMLDNQLPSELATMAASLKAEYPAVIIEGSGVSDVLVSQLGCTRPTLPWLDEEQQSTAQHICT